MDSMDKLAKIKYNKKIQYEQEKKETRSVTAKGSIWTEEIKTGVVVAIIIMLAFNPFTIGVLIWIIFLMMNLADFLVIAGASVAFFLIGARRITRRGRISKEAGKDRVQVVRSSDTFQAPASTSLSSNRYLRHFLLIYGSGYLGGALMFIITGLVPEMQQHVLFSITGAVISFVAGVTMVAASRAINRNRKRLGLLD
ncbi:MAG: hypothetical protein ACFFD4_36645 [Candidatus Odinarchaeota archaeon]